MASSIAHATAARAAVSATSLAGSGSPPSPTASHHREGPVTVHGAVLHLLSPSPSPSSSSSSPSSSPPSFSSSLQVEGSVGSSSSAVFGRVAGDLASLRSRGWPTRSVPIGIATCRATAGAATSATASITAPTRKTLGSSDLLVSEACLGTMMFTTQTEEKLATELLDMSFDLGVNFFDTAEVYPIRATEETVGSSEEILGRWMKTKPRDKVIVATKVAGGTGEGRPFKGSICVGNRKVPQVKETLTCTLDRQNILEAADASLRRLQTDYIDLYQTHWPDRYVPSFGSVCYNPANEFESVPFNETVGAIGELIRAGKIRHWGVSNETTFGVCKIVETCDKLGVPRPISIQNSYSLLHRQFEYELAEACSPSNYNISLLSWSPLAGGALSGKYVDGEPPEGTRFAMFSAFMSRFISGQTQEATSQYVQIAHDIGITPAQLALAFCKSRWFMGSTIFGATSAEQLKEDLEAFSIELSPDTISAINKVFQVYRDPPQTVA